jgi:O-antigen ligase
MAAPNLFAAGPERPVDAALAACLLAIAFQAVPLPPALLAWVSPDSEAVQARLSLAIAGSSPALSIDAELTRAGLASATSAILVFWAARETFARGGLRIAARAVGIAGFAMSLMALAARATAPTLILWTWTPIDPGAKPFGPFVSRNDFAAWLLLASALTAGYTIMHVRTYGLLRIRSMRIALRNVLADGTGLLFGGATAVMILTIVSSLSRGALLGAGAAVLCGHVLWRGRAMGATARAPLAVVLLLAVLVLGAWVNRSELTRRLSSGTEVSRATIWRETLPILSDFPIAGTGIGTYGRSMLVYQRTTPELLFNHAHSEYLQLLAEGGLLVGVPAIAAALTFLALARRRLQDEKREVLWMRIGCAAGMAGLLMQCLWDATLRMPANAMLFALLAAVVVHEKRDVEAGTPWPLRGPRPTSLNES